MFLQKISFIERSKFKRRNTFSKPIKTSCTVEIKRHERKTLKLPTLGHQKYWNFNIFPKEYINLEKMSDKDKTVLSVVTGVHIGALFAPFTYTHNAFLIFIMFYLLSAIGITLSYHRQLTHKSFQTSKMLEYFFALCGMLAIQGHPLEWVSAHRHHHTYCDKEKDPHSPMDGFWWSHIGWLFDYEYNKVLLNTKNVADLKKVKFYRELKRFYIPSIFLQIFMFYFLSGFSGLIWGFFLRVVFVWHVTWAVNSLSHVWGFQSFKTGDISMNNWFVALLALGEGWHNNHHAFEESAAHGLKWWQFDPTWYLIWILKKLKLAWNVRLPTKERLTLKEI